MGTEILSLQHELEEAKNSLKNVDEHLKKLIGRDPSELPPRVNKRPVTEDKGRPGNKTNNRGRGYQYENEEPPAKRRPMSVFSRLSDKVPDIPQRGLISKVIVTPKEIPSREQALEAQNKDEKFKARNRRMFGALLGTLQKFQQEETKLKSREDKRAQLEKKIEEHEIKEKEEIRKERQELFLNRKKKQAEIKIIELKMLRMKEYNAWEETQIPRKNFILTKSKPHLHYLPRRLNEKSRELLAASQTEVEKLIEVKKQEVTDELQHIEDRIKRNFDNRSFKSDNNESGDVHDPEEHLEDVLAESQIAVANVVKNSENVISEGDKNQEEQVSYEHSVNSSDNSGAVEVTNNVINGDNQENTNVQQESPSVNNSQSDEAVKIDDVMNDSNLMENVSNEENN